MGWTEAHAHLVEMIVGTQGLTTKNGLPRKFKHVPELFNDDGGLICDTRCFGIMIEEMAAQGGNTVELPIWFQYELVIAVVYRTMTDMASLYEAIALDHARLTRQLRDTDLQGATSTIENLWQGDGLILRAEVRPVPGGLVIEHRISIDFREE